MSWAKVFQLWQELSGVDILKEDAGKEQKEGGK